MKSLVSTAIAVCIFMCLSLSLNAQSKTSIILIDGVATEVKMGDDGTILEVIKQIPNYMSEYDNDASDYSSGSDQVIEADYNLYPSNGSSDADLLSNGAFKIIYFKTGEATMTEATLIKLRDIAGKIKTSGQLVMLNSFYKRGDSNSKTLVGNRASACRSYLICLGIEESRIIYATEEANAERAKINVFVK